MFRSNAQVCDDDDDHRMSLAPPRHLDSRNDQDDEEENNIAAGHGSYHHYLQHQHQHQQQQQQHVPSHLHHQRQPQNQLSTNTAAVSSPRAITTTAILDANQKGQHHEEEMMAMQLQAAAAAAAGKVVHSSSSSSPHQPGNYANNNASWSSSEAKYQAKLKIANAGSHNNTPAKGTFETATTMDSCGEVPGAVRERGIRYQGIAGAGAGASMSSSSSHNSDDGSGYNIGEPFHAFGSSSLKDDDDMPILTAEVVVVSPPPVQAGVFQTNNNNNNNNLQAIVDGQFLQRADEIAQQVVQQLRGEVGRAREVEEIDDTISLPKGQTNNTTNTVRDSDTISKKGWLYLSMIGCGCIVVSIVVVVIVVVVLLVNRQNPTGDGSVKNPSSLPPTPTTAPRPPSTPPPPSSPSTSAPTSSSTIPPDRTTTSCGDFPCNSTLTVMELVNRASNHTLLAQYLNRDFNSKLKDYLDSEFNSLTLFAPTDESFQALPPPVSLYFINHEENWDIHQYIMLANHILVFAEDATEIFQSTKLQPYRKRDVLTVNQVNRTIQNDVSIVVPDIHAGNGYIHVPDRVINYFTTQKNTLLDNAVQPSFSFHSYTTKFRGLLNVSGLEGTLLQNWENGMTLYVPEDQAFDLLDNSVTAKLFETPDVAFIKDLIAYHILPLNLLGLTPQHENAIWMYNNVSAWFTSYDANNDTYTNLAKQLNPYLASNGFFIVIDQVLLPPQNVGELLKITNDVTMGFNVTTFVELVQEYAHLGNLLNGTFEGRQNLGNYFSDSENLLVFAPIESAFTIFDSELLSRLAQPTWLLHLQSLCRHHFAIGKIPNEVGQYQLDMLSGVELTLDVISATSSSLGVETIDGVTIQKIRGSGNPFIGAPEGVIRFLDGVLLPPWVSQSVYDKLLETQNVSSFVHFAQMANIAALLFNTTANNPITVFAPTDAAIANSGNRTTSITSLQEFVLRHVVRGNMYTSLLGTTSNIVSMANVTLQVSNVGNSTYVGGALILDSNILASNGVVHVINHVLF